MPICHVKKGKLSPQRKPLRNTLHVVKIRRRLEQTGLFGSVFKWKEDKGRLLFIIWTNHRLLEQCGHMTPKGSLAENTKISTKLKLFGYKKLSNFSIKMSVMDKVMQESSSWCWWRRCWSSRTTFLYVWTFSNKDSANPNDFLLMDTFQPQFQP